MRRIVAGIIVLAITQGAAVAKDAGDLVQPLPTTAVQLVDDGAHATYRLRLIPLANVNLATLTAETVDATSSGPGSAAIDAFKTHVVRSTSSAQLTTTVDFAKVDRPGT